MKITIIYNPNSTGSSLKNAEATRERLKIAHDVELVATDFAGHAEQLARELTLNRDNHMIISSSGDGGYHEVVNGVLSVEQNSHITLGLLPSGNANDHYRSAHRGSLLSRIENKDADHIDAIKISCDQFTRFAHSYIGLGVTANIGEKLNQTALNPISEKLLVIKHLFEASPVKIAYNNKLLRYDNLLFSNIGEMSKMLTISQNANPSDGKFEITSRRAGNILGLIQQAAKAATTGLNNTRQSSLVQFRVLTAAKVQLDGEIYEITKGSQVVIESAPKAIRCII